MPKTSIYGLNRNHILDQTNLEPSFKIVTDMELQNDDFRLDALNDIRLLAMPIPRRYCTDHFTNLYRDLEGCFADGNGNEVFLEFEPVWEMCDEWWSQAVKTPAPRTKAIVLRAENIARLRVVFSLYRACFPERAMLWGVRASNDNEA